DGVPRYPKMHPCGLVLSRQPLHELTPTFIANKGWATTHFDMDAVETIGLVKMDLLAQGGLAVMRDVKAMLVARGVEVDLEKFTVNEAVDGPGGKGEKGQRGKGEGSPAAPLFSSSPPPLFSSASSTSSDEADFENEDGEGQTWKFNDPAVWEMIAGG